MNVQEIMSQPAVTCRPDDTLNTAAKQMWECDCGVLPVVDDNGDVVGMITDRDICMSAYTQGRPLDAIQVSDAMAKQVFTVRPDESLDAAERLMSDKQIRRVPVVDGDNRPIGMLSLNDIARQALATRKKNGIEREISQTLAAICQPRSQTPGARMTPQQQPAAM